MGVLSINTNTVSLGVQRQLAKASSDLSGSMERLSSGLRINRAGDDAAGLAVSESLKTDARVYAQGVRNLNDGISALNIANGAVEQLSNITLRLTELAEQAANGALGSSQRQALDEDAQALSKEFTRIVNSTEFNGKHLLKGDYGTLQLQAGYGANGGIESGMGGAVGDGTFGGAVSYAGESGYSFAAALGDLNGDGVLDLVTAGQTDGTDGYATIRLGQGDGSFGGAASYATESYRSFDAALGDLNGDGVLDLVTAGETDSSDGYATIRLGQGDGTFGGAVSYATESYRSLGTALGDLNGDGALDLVTAGGAYDGSGGYDGYATVRLGRGDGTFGVAVSYAVESHDSFAAALEDLNSDGVLDLVTAGYTDGDVGCATVRLGQGDGTFGGAASYTMESYRSIATALGDLNGDGVFDLVTAGMTDGFDGYATVRLGLGNGTFGEATSFATEGYTSRAAELGDLNGDGALDLLTAGITEGFDGYATVRLSNTQNGTSPLLPFDLSTIAGARQALPIFQRKIDQLAAQRGTICAFQNRVNTALSVTQSTALKSTEAASRITDADIAEESARMVRLNILRQTAASVLAQANQQPALTLKLLG